MGMQISLRDNDFVSFRNTLSRRISESCGRFFSPQAISILLSVVAVPVYISTKSVPFPGHSFQHLLSLVCLIIILGRVKQCLIVILIYIFLMISDVERFLQVCGPVCLPWRNVCPSILPICNIYYMYICNIHYICVICS